MSAIWFHSNVSLTALNALCNGTMGAHLDMQFTEVGDNFIKATMPVDHRTTQPYGLLHGGASVALAETLGSVASAFVIDQAKYLCVGLEINANHVRSVKSGRVTGMATPIHLGAKTHVWDIRISDDKGKLCCISRLTVAILPHPAH